MKSITGIEHADNFIAALPSLFKPDTEWGSPVAFCFQPDGQLIIVEARKEGSVDGNVNERDDFMNNVANAVIAVVKTNPIAVIVIVSEVFITSRGGDQGSPAPVDCDRFSKHAKYREQILGERTESFAAFIEDASGSRIMKWPIIREGATRRLGAGGEVTSGLMGRFTNLLRKQHALDPVLQTAPITTPYAPVPIESLRASYAEPPIPLERVNDLEPALLDFPDDLRLLVAQFQGEFSLLGINPGKPIGAAAFVDRMIAGLNLISGRGNTSADILKKYYYPKIGAVNLLIRRHGEWRESSRSTSHVPEAPEARDGR